MKLELEINSAQNSSLDNHSNIPNTPDAKAEEVKKMLRSGISLAKEGSRAEARQMLLKVTEAEPNSETAWLWLASISEYPEELLVFLQNVLKINPENERALEWSKQTKTLLSKTFVQRGINASRDGQKEFAKQCFLQGIVHDSENEMAWLWLASTSDSQDEKVSHLQKVLYINPENETALSSLNAVKNQMSQALLKKANSAAISGDHENAQQLLEEIMKNTPNLEEAWILKAFLANSYYEKIECYQKALQLNPENETAQAGLASLQTLTAKVSKPAPEVSQPVVSEEPKVFEETEPEVLEQGAGSQEFEQPENHQVFDEQNVARESFTETSFAETETQENPVEESQLLFENEAVAKVQLQAEAQPESQTESFVEEKTEVQTESFVEQTFQTQEELFVENQTQEEVFAEEQTKTQEEIFVDETQPVQTQEVSFAEPSQQSEPAPVQEEQFVAEENQPQAESEFVEPADSPTQELDEEFVQNAEAVFSSYEQSESVVEEVEEKLQELQAEPQAYQNEEAEAVSESAQTVEEEEEEVFEQAQTEEFQSSEAAETESVLANETEAEVETGQPQEMEETSSPAYQSPYFSNNGFESVPLNEAFVDHNQPTVEFSYSNPTNFSEPAVIEKSFEQKEEIVVQESFPVELPKPAPAQAFEHNGKEYSNGFVVETVENKVVEAPLEEVKTETVLPTEVQLQLIQCPFCEFENEVQTVVCHSCQAMLSLSDLEMMIAHQGANQDLLLSSIEKMEVERTLREFSVEEITALGIAHLNAKNLRKGLSYLQEASQLIPNDVVLTSKVNFLAIRLNEIEEQDHKALENPVQSRTIMVVDDSPTVRKLISGKLEKSGHSVISAVDGMDALAKINEVIPDLILLDITMPRLDGYQVCKLIRNNEITKDIPIVMISGKDGFFDKVRGRMAGSSGYITKPFGPDTLMKTIETYLS